jgi:hypothetical protein
VFFVDQCPAHVDDFADMLRSAREMIDRVDSHAGEDALVFFTKLVGKRVGSDVQLGRRFDDFVVHVGDVDDPSDVESLELKIPLDGVEDHRADQMADVRGLVHRHSTEVHPDLAGTDGFEQFLFTAEAVVNAKAHWGVTLRLRPQQHNGVSGDGQTLANGVASLVCAGFDIDGG